MKKNKKNILLGITGGIAAYKSLTLISILKKKGYNVDVIVTQNGKKFVSPIVIETLSGNVVVEDMFDRPDHRDVEHISLAEKADLVVVAPATYNIIGKVASGIADDMLSTVISASKAPVFFAMAMNTNMYENPILKENVLKLSKLGYNFIEADSGKLACNTTGKGRMKEPEEIATIIDNYFVGEKILSGKKILITAGRTEEPLDPVRYFTNGSSGKMGYSLAKAASKMGAEVTLISGPNDMNYEPCNNIVKVRTAKEMYDAVMKNYEKCDIAIMSAAVADYRPIFYSEEKIKKSSDKITVEFEKNPDILLTMGQNKKKQFLVGFAAESTNLIENAIVKFKKKNLNMIIANNASNIGSDNNKIFIIRGKNQVKEFNEMNKEELAYHILREIIAKEGENNAENNA